MKHTYKFILMLIVSVMILIPGTAMADEAKYNSGIITCGYNFDNYENFSSWNIKNMNRGVSEGIYILRIAFVDEFGNTDRQYDFTEPDFLKGHWNVISEWPSETGMVGLLGEKQSDVFRSQDLDFSIWNSGEAMPKRGQVSFHWGVESTLNVLPLGVNHVRTRKYFNKQGKLLGVARTQNGCRTVTGNVTVP